MAIALREAVQAALLVWMPISTRLISASTSTTLNAVEGAKNSIYDDLEDADSVPSGDMLIAVGDWNARTGPVDMATQHILG